MFCTSLSVAALVAEACENFTTGSLKRNGKKYIYKETFVSKFPSNGSFLPWLLFFVLKMYVLMLKNCYNLRNIKNITGNNQNFYIKNNQ